MKLATSYFGCRIPRHVKQDMKRLRRLGFDRVIHTFSENDLLYYPETMKEITAISHEAGLEVLLDPWGVGRVFGGEAFSRWIVEDPDLVQRGPSGRPLGGACLNHPRLRERMREWTDVAAETGARKIFWDEPHWVPQGPFNPSGEACVCEHCRREASVLSGGELDGMIPNDLSRASRTQLERFRAHCVNMLLRELAQYASTRGLASSVCVLPRGVSDQPDLDWDAIAAIPGIGEFGTDPYWQAFRIETREERDAFIDTNTRRALAASGKAGIDTMLWIQAFRIHREREDDLLEGARRLLSHRPQTVAVWGFDACAHMSALACDDSPRVWRRLVRLLRSRPPGSAPGSNPDDARSRSRHSHGRKRHGAGPHGEGHNGPSSRAGTPRSRRR